MLYVEFRSGKEDVMTLARAGKARVSAKAGTAKKIQRSLQLSPVNAIFVRNRLASTSADDPTGPPARPQRERQREGGEAAEASARAAQRGGLETI